MPQLFQVLKCFKCFVFQVHQTKKSNKWECKLCGEKQSIKRHYGIGTGKECRLHVQKLNGIRGEIDELNETTDSRNSDEDVELEIQNRHSSHNFHKAEEKKSKWSNFVDQKEDVPELEVNESMYLGNTEVVLEVPVKKRRKFNAPKVNLKSTGYSHNYVDGMTKSKEIQYQDNNTTFCKPDVCVSTNIFSDSCKPSSKTSSKPIVSNIEIKSDIEVFKKNDIHRKLNDPEIKEMPIKPYVPPTVNKDSKWAQFTDEPDENENPVFISRENSLEKLPMNTDNSSENVPNNLFTLCEENELDEVLDF